MNWVALRSVPSSTQCRTGWPSRYMMSIRTSSLNCVCSIPIATLNRLGDFWMCLHVSQCLKISSSSLRVSSVNSSGLGFLMKINYLSVDGFENCFCSRMSCNVVRCTSIVHSMSPIKWLLDDRRRGTCHKSLYPCSEVGSRTLFINLFIAEHSVRDSRCIRSIRSTDGI